MKVKVLLRVKDLKGNILCEVKQGADIGILRIVGEISWWSNNAEQFRAALDSLKKEGLTKLKTYMNSGGGSVFEANEIANLIVAFCKPEDRFLKVGALCCSAATIIAEKFTVENTTASSNVTWMKHNPRGIQEGEERDMISYATLLKNIKNVYVKNWSKRMKISETILRNKMDGTWWLSQEELIQYNVVSKFDDAEDTLPTDTAQVFNKYQYEKVPQVLNNLFTKPPVQEKPVVENNNKNENKKPMKNFLTLLLATMSGLTEKLKADADEATAVAVINQFFKAQENEITTLKQQLKDEKEKVTKMEATLTAQADAAYKAALDGAETMKKITPDQRKEFEKQKDKIGLDGLTAILNTMTPRVSLKNQLNNTEEGGKGKKKEGEDNPEGEDARVEPEFSEGEGGRRIYDSVKQEEGKVKPSALARRIAMNQAERQVK